MPNSAVDKAINEQFKIKLMLCLQQEDNIGHQLLIYTALKARKYTHWTQLNDKLSRLSICSIIISIIISLSLLG